MTAQAPANWYPDPTGRHEVRYWDGSQWTEHVASRGLQSSDPVVAVPPVPAALPTDKKVLRQVQNAGVVESGWAGSGSPLTEPVLVVNQKPKLIEVNAEYAIYDQNGQKIGAVQEVGRTFLKNVLGPIPTSSKSKRLNVVDADGRILLTLTRPAALVRSTVTVRRADGSVVGQIVQRLSLATWRFSLEADGKKLGSIGCEDWNGWDFSVQDKSGDEIARVTKSWAGFGLQMSRKKDKYVVQVQRKLDEPLRSLVVAAALAIDTALRQ